MVSRVGHLARRARGLGLQASGITRLTAGLATGRVRELWIGDSHSVLLNTERFPLWMGSVGEGRFVWHLGPRILHSIATNGFPPVVERVADRLRRLPASRRLTCFFVFGEIDVRCHLGPRVAAGIDDAFVTAYVDRAVALADRLGAARVVIVTPTPPSDHIADHVMFPIAGDVAQRTAAHRWLSDALVDAVPAGDPRVGVLDLRAALADEDGRLPEALTYDGCHTNDAGRAAVRRLVRDHLSSSAPGAPRRTAR
ncbi:SGNH/GDSL hydrolase family protein [Nocardioides sp. TF02-7]|uniref:SGNH/GDSL hydrolase family protein n=1 Tax=Nocardioides sp. TF02-7 TaxID=2917724 RepID=UPI001F062D1B|nr:SGNH/GDSL hydrolase family protein [Nocardioides sp. TF02-7]UMG91121.1 SGNH/GDSL hydrolase family protein [Nocardioides sp. TF02-7]